MSLSWWRWRNSRAWSSSGRSALDVELLLADDHAAELEVTFDFGDGIRQIGDLIGTEEIIAAMSTGEIVATMIAGAGGFEAVGDAVVGRGTVDGPASGKQE